MAEHSSSRSVVRADDAPAAVGPYSQAIRAGSLIFTAGQVGIDPRTKQFSGNEVATQTKQALENLQAVLKAAGSGLEHVVKTTVFLTTMDHFTAMNEIYGQYWSEAPPARSTVAVAALPLGALVEIECIALVP